MTFNHWMFLWNTTEFIALKYFSWIYFFNLLNTNFLSIHQKSCFWNRTTWTYPLENLTKGNHMYSTQRSRTKMLCFFGSPSLPGHPRIDSGNSGFRNETCFVNVACFVCVCVCESNIFRIPPTCSSTAGWALFSFTAPLKQSDHGRESNLNHQREA